MDYSRNTRKRTLDDSSTDEESVPKNRTNISHAGFSNSYAQPSGDPMQRGIDHLRRLRHADTAEQLQEDREEFGSRAPKRKMETLDDSSDDEVLPTKTSKNEQGIGWKLLQKQGYQKGAGLGKSGQGRTEPVEMSKQKGRAGLGHETTKVLGRDMNEIWNDEIEDKTIEEKVLWCEPCDIESRERAIENCSSDNWIQVSTPKYTIEDEAEFCDIELLNKMLKAKDVFDNLSDRELREARTRANPYETIGCAFFMNRAAMKTANMDRVFDWIFSGETDEKRRILKNPYKNPTDKGINDLERSKDLFYFADVCAGPGGFSEYMLWRKGFYNSKGFGFTLRGNDDFKLWNFQASSSYLFEPYYGAKNDGDVTNPDNIETLQDFISKGTDGVGVHLMMADGGFSVTKRENIQEILSKRIYLCQLLVSLCIVREGGNFFCKLFDLFTPFSAGLLYLMYVCYDQVCLHKPHTSRPANSERYIICKGLRKEYSDVVRDYLKRVNRKMQKFWENGEPQREDVMGLVPLEIIKSDEKFLSYFIDHNEKLAVRQTVYLNKYLSFARNHNQIDRDQSKLRNDCLEYWMVPNKNKKGRGQRGSYNNDNDITELNPAALVGTLFTNPMSVDFNSNVPVFNIKCLSDALEKQITQAEYACNFVCATRTTKEIKGRQKKLIASCAKGLFMYTSNTWNHMDKSTYRIPVNSILLVEETEAYRDNDGSLDKTQKIQALRILDAALLAGDNINHLSYEHRIQAINKFCKALKLVVPVITEGKGAKRREIKPALLHCAVLWKLKDIRAMADTVTVRKESFEDVPYFKENGFYFKCEGIRFSRIIKSHWTMNWSMSSKSCYGYTKEVGSRSEAEFYQKEKKNNVWSSFTDTVYPSGKCDIPMTSIWVWQNSLENGYGVRTILYEDEHPSGPTVNSVISVVEANNRKWNANPA